MVNERNTFYSAWYLLPLLQHMYSNVFGWEWLSFLKSYKRKQIRSSCKNIIFKHYSKIKTFRCKLSAVGFVIRECGKRRRWLLLILVLRFFLFRPLCVTPKMQCYIASLQLTVGCLLLLILCSSKGTRPMPDCSTITKCMRVYISKNVLLHNRPTSIHMTILQLILFTSCCCYFEIRVCELASIR